MKRGQLPLSLGSWGLRQAQKGAQNPSALLRGGSGGAPIPSLLLLAFT